MVYPVLGVCHATGLLVPYGMVYPVVASWCMSCYWTVTPLWYGLSSGRCLVFAMLLHYFSSRVLSIQSFVLYFCHSAGLLLPQAMVCFLVAAWCWSCCWAITPLWYGLSSSQCFIIPAMMLVSLLPHGMVFSVVTLLCYCHAA